MKLLLTGAFQYHEGHFDAIRALGHDIIFVQDERIPLTKQGIYPSGIEGTVCNGLFLYNDISAFKNLRYVQLTSAGFDRVPLEAMQKKNITVHNARGVYNAPIAELALCGVLQLYKQSVAFRDNQRSHRWTKLRNLKELTDKNICIVGCGSLGQACAKRFGAFDCHVIGVDVAPVENTFFEKIYLLDALDDALAQSDVVILTLPLTTQTKGLFNRERFLNCKEGTVFVNITRGAVVAENDLITVLRDAHLAGAVLDVFETEPLQADSPLWDMENVILTPHNSFVGDGNSERLFDLIVKNLRSAGEHRG